ncbi:type I phosphodiesterase/nucleotide pyrophosphatase [Capsaspora owczarzaki ATCC 30864]|uniref:Type I phosphodiesterase/nucleotide pyrophosphatase n=1 Tax=Capsaspora owczarzaki (strain ATCC 30864) TaxID=595528 RepID=A0A0D2WQ21_CAPO3|nr:type I phosphodiesterase/nucleotide pyrophosphatase [Capsaspora owczarzaki ATCC 30864]KJE93645.1 type I phosphodiesterase/nucleotide pyrophosphatase [Capsaspora owczarzaki ATCC 30864]|eukprot:XP_004348228.2 type I phosphodiesterase/nucleotide pyrophosphatase [Capsaspora owczarzaki ATCC 30864]
MSAAAPPVNGGFGSAAHVVVLGIDGIAVPEFLVELQGGRLPNFARIRANGRYSDHTRAVAPTWSKPNWASILYGADTSIHGVDSNDWRLDGPQAVPSIVGSAVPFPNLFSVLKAQEPDSATASIYAWPGISTLTLPRECVDFDREFADQDRKTIDCAKAHLLSAKPRLTFIHLDDVDHAGHDHGSGSEYRAALRTTDQMLGELLETIEAAGMKETTLLLIVSDHGRDSQGKDHGGWSLSEIETTWMAYGAMVPPAPTPETPLSTPVSLVDTSPTVLHALGLDQPLEWRGRPVLEVFGVKPKWVWAESAVRKQAA